MAEEGICVAIRVRPLNGKERIQGQRTLWRCLPAHNSITLTTPEGNPIPDRTPGSSFFTYDKVFTENATTFETYQTIGSPIVSSVFEGFNGTIFAYGQTSSGKTYTMVGEEGHGDGEGILHLAAREIFHLISNTADRDFLLRVSYVEIYNENIRDLLDPETPSLQIREDPKKGVYIEAAERIITDFGSILKAAKDGNKHRRVESTLMNERSSRSHTIFRMILESKERRQEPLKGRQESDAVTNSGEEGGGDVEGAVLMGTLNLVDLAGSESVRHTGATGSRAKEGGKINQSLLTLSRVIHALGQEGHVHKGFRDSKLTRILQPSLSGNAKMAVVCCITPGDRYLEETRSTLQFASRAKMVRTCAVVNEVLDDRAQLKRLKKELQDLKERQRMLEEGGGHLEDVSRLEAEKQLMTGKVEELEAVREVQATKIDKLTHLILHGGGHPTLSYTPLNPDSLPGRGATRRHRRLRETWCPGEFGAALPPGAAVRALQELREEDEADSRLTMGVGLSYKTGENRAERDYSLIEVGMDRLSAGRDSAAEDGQETADKKCMAEGSGMQHAPAEAVNIIGEIRTTLLEYAEDGHDKENVDVLGMVKGLIRRAKGRGLKVWSNGEESTANERSTKDPEAIQAECSVQSLLAKKDSIIAVLQRQLLEARHAADSTISCEAGASDAGVSADKVDIRAAPVAQEEQETQETEALWDAKAEMLHIKGSGEQILNAPETDLDATQVQAEPAIIADLRKRLQQSIEECHVLQEAEQTHEAELEQVQQKLEQLNEAYGASQESADTAAAALANLHTALADKETANAGLQGAQLTLQNEMESLQAKADAAAQIEIEIENKVRTQALLLERSQSQCTAAQAQLTEYQAREIAATAKEHTLLRQVEEAREKVEADRALISGKLRQISSVLGCAIDSQKGKLETVQSPSDLADLILHQQHLSADQLQAIKSELAGIQVEREELIQRLTQTASRSFHDHPTTMVADSSKANGHSAHDMLMQELRQKVFAKQGDSLDVDVRPEAPQIAGSSDLEHQPAPLEGIQTERWSVETQVELSFQSSAVQADVMETKDLMAEVARATEAFEASMTQVREVQGILRMREAEVARLTQERQEAEGLMAETARLTEALRASERQVCGLQDSLTVREEEVTGLIQKGQEASDQLSLCKCRVEKIEVDQGHLEQLLCTREVEIENVRQQLTTQRVSADHRLTELRKTLDEKNSAAQGHQQQLDELVAEVVGCKAQLAESATQLEHMVHKETAYEALQSQMQLLSHRVSDLNELLSDKEVERRVCSIALEEAQLRTLELERSEADLTEALVATKEEMKKKSTAVAESEENLIRVEEAIHEMSQTLARYEADKIEGTGVVEACHARIAELQTANVTLIDEVADKAEALQAETNLLADSQTRERELRGTCSLLQDKLAAAAAQEVELKRQLAESTVEHAGTGGKHEAEPDSRILAKLVNAENAAAELGSALSVATRDLTDARQTIRETEDRAAELLQRLEESRAEVRRGTERLELEIGRRDEELIGLREKGEQLNRELRQAQEALRIRESTELDVTQASEEIKRRFGQSQLQLDLAVGKVGKLEGSIKELEADRNRLLREADEEGKDLRMQLIEWKEAAQGVSKLEREVGGLTDTAETLRRQREQLSVEKTEAEERAVAAAAALDELSKEVIELRERLPAGDTTQQTAEIQRLYYDLGEIQAAEATLRSETATTQVRQKRLQREIETLHIECSTNRDEKEQLQAEIISLRAAQVDPAEISYLQEALAAKNEDFAALHAEMQTLSGEIEQLAETKAEVDAQLEGTRAQLAVLAERGEAHATVCMQLEDSRAQAEEKSAALRLAQAAHQAACDKLSQAEEARVTAEASRAELLKEVNAVFEVKCEIESLLTAKEEEARRLRQALQEETIRADNLPVLADLRAELLASEEAYRTELVESNRLQRELTKLSEKSDGAKEAMKYHMQELSEAKVLVSEQEAALSRMRAEANVKDERIKKLDAVKLTADQVEKLRKMKQEHSQWAAENKQLRSEIESLHSRQASQASIAEGTAKGALDTQAKTIAELMAIRETLESKLLRAIAARRQVETERESVLESLQELSLEGLQFDEVPEDLGIAIGTLVERLKVQQSQAQALAENSERDRTLLLAEVQTLIEEKETMRTKVSEQQAAIKRDEQVEDELSQKLEDSMVRIRELESRISNGDMQLQERDLDYHAATEEMKRQIRFLEQENLELMMEIRQLKDHVLQVEAELKILPVQVPHETSAAYNGDAHPTQALQSSNRTVDGSDYSHSRSKPTSAPKPFHPLTAASLPPILSGARSGKENIQVPQALLTVQDHNDTVAPFESLADEEAQQANQCNQS